MFLFSSFSPLSPSLFSLSLSLSLSSPERPMLLRALAATSAEGWEEEEEKLRSRDDRIKNAGNVINDDDGRPLKQPASSTFGSFLGARRATWEPSSPRSAEYEKECGKRRRERRERKEEKEREATRLIERDARGEKNSFLALFFHRTNTPKHSAPADRNRNPKTVPAEAQENLPSNKKKQHALSDSLTAAKGRFLPLTSSSSTPSSSASALLSLAALPVSCAARAGDALFPASVSGAAARLLDGVVDAAASVVLSSPSAPKKRDQEKERETGGGGEQQEQPSSSSSSSRPASTSRLGRFAAALASAPERASKAAAGENKNDRNDDAVVVVEAQLLSSPFTGRLALPASTPVAEVLERVVEATSSSSSSSIGPGSTATAESSGTTTTTTTRTRRLTFLLAEERPRIVGIVGGGGVIGKVGVGGGRAGAAAGLARIARAAAKRLAAPAAVTDPRSSSGSGTAGTKGALLAWMHFLLLPEPVNRELRGQGIVGWARGSAAWRAVAGGVSGEMERNEKEGESTSRASSLLRLVKNPFSTFSLSSSKSSSRPAPPRKRVIRADAPTLPPPPRGSTPVRVELRDGSVLRVVARPGATLGGLSASVERDLGILEEAQRFLVVEEPETGFATKFAGAAALAALRFSAGLAASTARRAAAVAGTAAAVVGVKGAGGEKEGEEEGEEGVTSAAAAGPFSIVVSRGSRRGAGATKKKKRSSSLRLLPLEFEVAPEATMAQVKAAVDAALLAEAEEEGGGSDDDDDESESESRSGSSSGDENGGPRGAAAASISLVFPRRRSRGAAVAVSGNKGPEAARRSSSSAAGGGGGGRRRSEIVRIEAAV